eukprot:SAG22_NODE_3507_length_1674_cov_0.920635_1_plen_497_part_10
MYAPIGPSQFLSQCKPFTAECQCAVETTSPTPSSDRSCVPWTECSACKYETVAPTSSTDRECESAPSCDGDRTYQTAAPTTDLSCSGSIATVKTARPECTTLTTCNPSTSSGSPEYEYRAPGICQLWNGVIGVTDVGSSSAKTAFADAKNASFATTSQALCITQTVGADGIIADSCGDYYTADRQCKCVLSCANCINAQTCREVPRSAAGQYNGNPGTLSEAGGIPSDDGGVVYTTDNRCQCIDSRSSSQLVASYSSAFPSATVKYTGTYNEETAGSTTSCTYSCQICRECNAATQYESAPCLHANDESISSKIIDSNGVTRTLSGGDLYLYINEDGVEFCNNAIRYSTLPYTLPAGETYTQTNSDGTTEELAYNPGATYRITSYGQCGLMVDGHRSCFYGCDEDTRCETISTCGCKEYQTTPPAVVSGETVAKRDRQCATKNMYILTRQAGRLDPYASYNSSAADTFVTGDGDNAYLSSRPPRHIEAFVVRPANNH